MKVYVEHLGTIRRVDSSVIRQMYCEYDTKYGLALDAVGVGALMISTGIAPSITSSPVFFVLVALIVVRILIRETNAIRCETSSHLANARETEETPRRPSPPAPAESERPPQTPVATATAPSYDPHAFWKGCVGSATSRLPAFKQGRSYAHYIPGSIA
jgi:hypothetical protein